MKKHVVCRAVGAVEEVEGQPGLVASPPLFPNEPQVMLDPVGGEAHLDGLHGQVKHLLVSQAQHFLPLSILLGQGGVERPLVSPQGFIFGRLSAGEYRSES